MNTWNRKNALWTLLYVALYAAGSAVVCVLGAVHPVMFVCYQIMAAVLLTGIAGKAFDRMKAPGAAACLALGMILLFFIIQDASPWHCVPLLVMGVLAEAVRFRFRYSGTGNLIASVIMNFSTFGFYGQIWLNRAYTYECAVEEMPAGYAETLMQCSPPWTFPVVVAVGILLSIAVYKMCAKQFRFEN